MGPGRAPRAVSPYASSAPPGSRARGAPLSRSTPSTAVATRVLVLALGLGLLALGAPAWWLDRPLAEAGAEWAWRGAAAGPAWGEGPAVVLAQLAGPLLGSGRAQALVLVVAVLAGVLLLARTCAALGAARPLLLGLLGGASVPLLAQAALGRLDLLFVPGLALVAGAALAAGSPRRRLAEALLGGVLLVGVGTPALVGSLGALALAAWWRDRPLWPVLLGLLPGLATGRGDALPWAAQGAAWTRALDPLGGPEVVGLGLAGLVLLALAAARAPAARLALLLPLLLALGPSASCGGEPVVLLGRHLPTPAVLLTALSWSWPVAAWSEAALALPALSALLLAGRDGARSGWLLPGLLALSLAEVLLAPGAPRVSPAEPVPLGVLSLAGGEGPVLDLPVFPPEDGRSQRRWHARYLQQQQVHGRPAPAAEPPGDPSPWAGEPLVGLALDASWASRIPDRAAGAVARAQGIELIVVHRAAVGAEELAVLDPVLRGLCGPPVRDLAGDLDVYRLDDGPSASVEAAWPWEELRSGRGLQRADWLERHAPTGSRGGR